MKLKRSISQYVSTETVRDAVMKTRRAYPAYWSNLLNTRSSCYGLNSKEIESAIFNASWDRMENQELLENCLLFISPELPGYSPYVPLESLSSSVVLVSKRISAHRAILTCHHLLRTELTYSSLLICLEGQEVKIKDFHPGDYLSRDKVARVNSLPAGQVMTRTRALALGYEWAVIE